MSRAAPAPRALFAATCVLSLVVLFTPSSGVPSGLPVSDKLVHLLLFAALAGTGRLARVPVAALLPGLVVYAGVSEVLQGWLPIGRDGDPADGLADVAGAVAGLLAVLVLRRRAPLE